MYDWTYMGCSQKYSSYSHIQLPTEIERSSPFRIQNIKYIWANCGWICWINFISVSNSITFIKLFQFKLEHQINIPCDFMIADASKWIQSDFNAVWCMPQCKCTHSYEFDWMHVQPTAIANTEFVSLTILSWKCDAIVLQQFTCKYSMSEFFEDFWNQHGLLSFRIMTVVYHCYCKIVIRNFLKQFSLPLPLSHLSIAQSVFCIADTAQTMNNIRCRFSFIVSFAQLCVFICVREQHISMVRKPTPLILFWGSFSLSLSRCSPFFSCPSS